MLSESNRRSGHYPVRVSLNITDDDSEALDRLEQLTGETRGVLVREAFQQGFPLIVDVYRKRRMREVAVSG